RWPSGPEASYSPSQLVRGASPQPAPTWAVAHSPSNAHVGPETPAFKLFEMAANPISLDSLGQGDDFVASFQIVDTPVRGRITRLGDRVLDPILKRHDYPRWAAHLLGEAVTLAVLVSHSLKFDGKVIVQAQGEGPVSLMVAEARSDGGVRGY